MPTIRVLKPFIFARPVNTYDKDGNILAVAVKETAFKPGPHEVDDETYAHPYISKYFADGRIEKPEVTQANADKQLADALAAKAQAEAILAEAQKLFERSTQQIADVIRTDAAVTEELTTASNKLREALATGDEPKEPAPPAEPAAPAAPAIQQELTPELVKELNTPANELRARQPGGEPEAASAPQPPRHVGPQPVVRPPSQPPKAQQNSARK